MEREKLYKIRSLIEKGSAFLSDEDALEGVSLFGEWKAGKHYEKDERFTYGTNDDGSPILWKAKSELDAVAHYPPNIAPTLYEQVGAKGQGDDPSNPIPYNGNMELFKGKYYSQDGVTYICTRDSGQPLYHPLAQLVGLYVEKV